MHRLDKEASRQRWKELRNLWNEYDPIGVMGGTEWPRDEYESYVGSTMRLLERDATVVEHVELLNQISIHMGLQFDAERGTEFGTKFVEWYSTNWPSTHV